jgi:hypothetical protein
VHKTKLGQYKMIIWCVNLYNIGIIGIVEYNKIGDLSTPGPWTWLITKSEVCEQANGISSFVSMQG